MLLSLFITLNAELLHAYIEDVFSLSVEANRSAECLLFQVPLEGLFYYIVQYLTSTPDGCCTSTDFVYKIVVLRSSDLFESIVLILMVLMKGRLIALLI